jgi:4-hydroxybutyrate CoA-transferase
VRRATAAEAIAAIAPCASVLLGGACGEPTTLTAALVSDADRLRGTTISSALHLGSFPFLAPELDGAFQYRTWLAAPGLADNPNVTFLPRSWGGAAAQVARERPDVALVQVAPPDRNGWFSLGASAGFAWQAARAARCVIAEVNRNAPRTPGRCFLRADQIDLAVETDAPLRAYRPAPPDPANARIAELLADLLPGKAPRLQVGIGSAPESLLRVLRDRPPRGLEVVSMATDGLVDLLAADGLLEHVTAGEILGTEPLFAAADLNPRFELRPSSFTHTARVTARYPRLVCVNSALELDLLGNANLEVANGKRVSSVGGALDFARAAARSPEARFVLALRATTSHGRSRIVRRLGQDIPTSIPWNLVDVVVTEHGSAFVSGKSPPERARALISVAAPDAREGLARAE